MAYNIVNFTVLNEDNTKTQICNCCGKTLKEYEVIKLHHQFSYGSKWDMSKLNANLCVKCWDIVVADLIAKCKVVNPLLEWTGNPYRQ